MPRRVLLLLLACAVLASCVPAAENAKLLPAEAAAMAGATRLAVIGDFGTGDQREQAIADALKKDDGKYGFDALVTVGDNVYPSGSPKDFTKAWTRPYGWVQRARIPVYASLGNHDDDSGATARKKLMSLLGMPGRWYARNVGNVQLIVLDANDVANPQQQQFLKQVLAAPRPAGTVWRMVVFHQPAYSCSRHQSTPDVQREWVPLFGRSGVDLVLNGHDHVYQRFAPIDGVSYVVTGGGGGSLYEMRRCPAGTPKPAAAEASRNYLVLEATGEDLRIQAVTADARLLDSQTVHRNATGTR